MKTEHLLSTLAWLGAALLVSPAHAQAPAKLVPAQSEVSFVTKQMGVPVDGKFKKFDAQIALDPKHPETGSVAFTIDMLSASMGVAETDSEMPKPIWFNTAKFPQATFKSTSIKGLGGGKFEVAGKLNIKGNARDVVVPVAITQSGANSTATGSFVIKRLEFKIGEEEWSDTTVVANDVTVRFKLALTGRATVSAAWLRGGAAATALLLSAAAQAQAPNYAIDPLHTFVNYENGHYGTTTNRGRFSMKDGTLFFDRANQQGKVEIVIDISSVNTGVDFLNRQLQGKDFFNVADFPTGTFVSDKFVFSGDKISEVQGKLTLKGQTLPVVLKAVKFNCYVNPLVKREVCGGDFETTIQRSQWGVMWGLQIGFEDAVKLIVQIEAIKL